MVIIWSQFAHRNVVFCIITEKIITGDKKWENILEQTDFVEKLTKY